MNMQLFVIISGSAYLVLLGLVFAKAAKHFVQWYGNSTPSLKNFGSMSDTYTMFLGRYLTRNGIMHRNKFFAWFGIFIVLATVLVIWVLALNSLPPQ